MTHEEKIAWMALWAARHGLKLELTGECGFGRPCVGVTIDDTYPDYEWHADVDYDSPDYGKRIDGNGDVWTPPNAYHKHPCVAVLGRGEYAEAELYDWLKWFDDNGFTVETGDVVRKEPFDAMEILIGKHRYARMVRKETG